MRSIPNCAPASPHPPGLRGNTAETPVQSAPDTGRVAATIARARPFVVPVLAALAVVWITLELWAPVAILWNDIHVPFAVNYWSEPPLFVQIHRIAAGQAAYLPPYTADSWTYGPFYGYLLAALDRFAESKPSIVSLRLISTTIGFLTIVPLLLALAGLRRRFFPNRSWVSAAVGSALIVVLFGLVDTRAFSFTALHPDVVAYLCVASAFAAVIWMPLVRSRGRLLGVLLAVCVAGIATKLNLVPLLVGSLAALAIERTIGWRTAAIAAAAALLPFLFVALVPSALREWTIVIPGHHWYETPRLPLAIMWREWTVEQPLLGVLVVAALAALGLLGAGGRKREAVAFGCLLGGVFIGAYAGLAKQGGGPFDLWFLYVACLVPTAAGIEALLAYVAPSVRRTFTARIAALAFLGLLVGSAAAGRHQHANLGSQERAFLVQDAARLARLCVPGRKVIVTWFVDPLIDCPSAQFSTWDSIAEIFTARPHGYRARIFLDDPIGNVTVIAYEPYGLPLRFTVPHVKTAIALWDGYSYGYQFRELDVWTPRGAEPP